MEIVRRRLDRPSPWTAKGAVFSCAVVNITDGVTAAVEVVVMVVGVVESRTPGPGVVTAFASMLHERQKLSQTSRKRLRASGHQHTYQRGYGGSQSGAEESARTLAADYGDTRAGKAMVRVKGECHSESEQETHA